jgi:hypothetical protein
LRSPPTPTGIAVKKPTGRDPARWYPATIENIFPGQKFVVILPEGVTDIKLPPFFTVSKVDWDTELRFPYFTTVEPVDSDIPVALTQDSLTLISSKHDLAVSSIISEDHCHNQGNAQHIQKYAYSDGDAFGSLVALYYQGNFMSANGDEGAGGYTAEIIQDTRIFRAIVDEFSSANGELTYARASRTTEGPTNTERLASGRPIINLNERKWITEGKVRIHDSTRYKNNHPTSGLNIQVGVIEELALLGRGMLLVATLLWMTDFHMILEKNLLLSKELSI